MHDNDFIQLVACFDYCEVLDLNLYRSFDFTSDLGFHKLFDLCKREACLAKVVYQSQLSPSPCLPGF